LSHGCIEEPGGINQFLGESSEKRKRGKRTQKERGGKQQGLESKLGVMKARRGGGEQASSLQPATKGVHTEEKGGKRRAYTSRTGRIPRKSHHTRVKPRTGLKTGVPQDPVHFCKLHNREKEDNQSRGASTVGGAT